MGIQNIQSEKRFQNISGGSRSYMLFKIGVLKNSQISQENTCVGVSF